MVRWAALLAVTVAVGLLAGAAGLPSPYMFAALFCGLAVALLRPGLVAVPPPVFVAAQALLGVAIGTYLQTDALRAVAQAWLPVLAVALAGLALCLVVAQVLWRTTALDPPTAALGSIAGGASGIVAMASELGADDRLVAFMQYLRVLVVVLTTPVIAALAFPAVGAGDPPPEILIGRWQDWVITAACATAGVLLGRALRLPAAALLGPLVIAGALALSGIAGDWQVPGLLREASFVGIGLQVGLRFTTETVRQVGRLLGPVLLSIVGLMVASFGVALVLAPWAGVTLLDAYLATTPGGLYAVLAVAFGAQADTTFILAVQILRLVVMIALAPWLVRRLVRTARRQGVP